MNIIEQERAKWESKHKGRDYDEEMSGLLDEARLEQYE